VLKGLSEPAGYMTAFRHTKIPEIRVFYAQKRDPRLNYLESLHWKMNLVVKIHLNDWRCRILLKMENCPGGTPN
jgi:hypothetical protein